MRKFLDGWVKGKWCVVTAQSAVVYILLLVFSVTDLVVSAIFNRSPRHGGVFLLVFSALLLYLCLADKERKERK